MTVLFVIGIYFLIGIMTLLATCVFDYDSLKKESSGIYIIVILLWPIVWLEFLVKSFPPLMKSLFLFLAKNIRKNLGMKDDDSKSS